MTKTSREERLEKRRYKKPSKYGIPTEHVTLVLGPDIKRKSSTLKRKGEYYEQPHLAVWSTHDRLKHIARDEDTHRNRRGKLVHMGGKFLTKTPESMAQATRAGLNHRHDFQKKGRGKYYVSKDVGK